MSQEPLLRPLDVSAVRARRAHLSSASSRVEHALRDVGRSDSHDWTREFAPLVVELARAWERHIGLTEAEDGLLEQVTTDAPRLAPMVARLRREHVDVAARLQTALVGLVADDAAARAASAKDLTPIMTLIGRHRRAGGDLIYQAYHIDIGGE